MAEVKDRPWYDNPDTAQGAAFIGQAIGNYFNYMGQREQYKTQQVLAKFNARMAMMQAEEKVDRIRRTAQRLRGSQRAAIGASGLAFDGNAIEVIADSMYEFELDVAAVKQSAILSRTNSLISASTADVNAGLASASAVLGLANTAAEVADYFGNTD